MLWHTIAYFGYTGTYITHLVIYSGFARPPDSGEYWGIGSIGNMFGEMSCVIPIVQLYNQDPQKHINDKLNLSIETHTSFIYE